MHHGLVVLQARIAIAGHVVTSSVTPLYGTCQPLAAFVILCQSLTVRERLRFFMLIAHGAVAAARLSDVTCNAPEQINTNQLRRRLNVYRQRLYCLLALSFNV